MVDETCLVENQLRLYVEGDGRGVVEERCTQYYLRADYYWRADYDTFFFIATVWTMIAHFTVPHVNGLHWGIMISQS